MKRLSRKLSLALDLLRQRDVARIGELIRRQVWSSYDTLCLRRDMNIPFPAPSALLPVHVRPAAANDLQQLLSTSEPDLSRTERWERSTRLHLARAGFSSCFVAVTDDDQPCYIQWLITPQENALLRQALHGHFPPLAPDEALLEAAYTPESFRGQRIMPAAMAMLAERAGELGARWVITYVGEDNIPSLKGCERAGFAPYRMKRTRWRLGRCTTRFLPLASDTSAR